MGKNLSMRSFHQLETMLAQLGKDLLTVYLPLCLMKILAKIPPVVLLNLVSNSLITEMTSILQVTNYNKLRVAVVVNQLRAYVARDVSRITSVNHVLDVLRV